MHSYLVNEAKESFLHSATSMAQLLQSDNPDYAKNLEFDIEFRSLPNEEKVKKCYARLNVCVDNMDKLMDGIL